MIGSTRRIDRLREPVPRVRTGGGDAELVREPCWQVAADVAIQPASFTPRDGEQEDSGAGRRAVNQGGTAEAVFVPETRAA